MSASDLRGMLALTFRDPDAGARAVLAVDWPREALWLGLLLTSVLAALLTTLTRIVAGVEDGALIGPIAALPAAAAAIQLAISWLLIQGLWRVGRAFGGEGGEPGAFALGVWLQVGLITLQGVQLLVAPLPLLPTLAGLAAVTIFFWWLTRFAMALHGFSSPWAVLGTSVLVLIAAVVALSAILGLLSGV